MFHLLQDLHEAGGWRMVFNLFRYVTFRASAAAGTSFLITVLVMPALIARLRRLRVLERASNQDSRKLSELHDHKNGTPTMGGLGLLAGLVGASVLWADLGNRYVQLALAVVMLLGGLGFADDWMKLRGICKRGMPGRWKLALQIAIALGFGSLLVMGHDGPFPATRLAVPFVKPDVFAVELGLAYIGFAALVVVGSSNAVNLTDGLDGLAAGCALISAIVYAVFVYIAGHSGFSGYLQLPFIRGAEEVVILCAALAGSTLGFLWYNSHPAEVFMGDTGSLPIGGLLAVAACAAKQELLLVLVGGVFVIEAGSVLLQVASFKLTGKRIFRIAPIHHHFQFAGWAESKVVTRFWIAAIVFALMSVATLKIR